MVLDTVGDTVVGRVALQRWVAVPTSVEMAEAAVLVHDCWRESTTEASPNTDDTTVLSVHGNGDELFTYVAAHSTSCVLSNQP